MPDRVQLANLLSEKVATKRANRQVVAFDLGADGVFWVDGRTAPLTVALDPLDATASVTVSAADLEAVLLRQVSMQKLLHETRMELSGDHVMMVMIGDLLH